MAEPGDWAFEWDRGNIAHIARHRVTPRQAEEALMDRKAVTVASYEIMGEHREEIVGMTGGVNPKLLLVVITERGDRIRVVSARKAVREEVEEYLQQ